MNMTHPDITNTERTGNTAVYDKVPDDCFTTCEICDRKVETLTRCDKCDIECCHNCLATVDMLNEHTGEVEEIELCKECEFDERVKNIIAALSYFRLTAKANIAGYINGNFWSGLELTFTPNVGRDFKVIIKKL